MVALEQKFASATAFACFALDGEPFIQSTWRARLVAQFHRWRERRRRARRLAAARRAAFEVLVGLNPKTLNDLGFRPDELESLAFGADPAWLASPKRQAD
ncbi:MAG: hypothetical protein AAF493_02740 [Pseudomonadota bacterium]